MGISVTFSDISPAQAAALINLAAGKTDDQIIIKTKKQTIEKDEEVKEESTSDVPEKKPKTKRETKPLTYDDARKEGEKLAANYSLNAVIKILSKKEYDTTSIKLMNKKHYRAFISDCRKYKEG